jgi:hypothetical protein
VLALLYKITKIMFCDASTTNSSAAHNSTNEFTTVPTNSQQRRRIHNSAVEITTAPTYRHGGKARCSWFDYAM